MSEINNSRRCHKPGTTLLALVLILSLTAGQVATIREASATVEPILPAVDGLYVLFGAFDIEQLTVHTDMDSYGNTIVLNEVGDPIPYTCDDGCLFSDLEYNEGLSIDFKTEDLWFDYIENGRVTHLRAKDLTLTTLDGKKAKTASLSDGPLEVVNFNATSIEKVKITYEKGKTNNTFILDPHLVAGFYDEPVMSAQGYMSYVKTPFINGNPKEVYLHVYDPWGGVNQYTYNPEQDTVLAAWDKDDKEYHFSGADLSKYVTITPISTNDPVHRIYKFTLTPQGDYVFYSLVVMWKVRYEGETWEENKQTYFTIADKIPVTRITLNKSKITLAKKGKTCKLKATVAPKDATDIKVTWKSSNKKVAKVNKSGKVTAVKKGKCKITCTASDGSGIKAVCSVKVKK